MAFILTEDNDYNTFLALSKNPDKIFFILKAIKESEPLQLSKAQIAVINATKSDPDFDMNIVAKQS